MDAALTASKTLSYVSANSERYICAPSWALLACAFAALLVHAQGVTSGHKPAQARDYAPISYISSQTE
jgi:hypothetical protein